MSRSGGQGGRGGILKRGTHQKHPAPNVALAIRSAEASSMSSTSKVSVLPASSWLRSSVTSSGVSLITVATMPLDSFTCGVRREEREGG